MIDPVVAKSISSRFRIEPIKRDRARHMRLIRFLHDHGWEPSGEEWHHRCRNPAKNFSVQDLFMAWHALGEVDLMDLLRCVLLDVPEAMQCREDDPLILTASFVKAYERDPRDALFLIADAANQLRQRADELVAQLHSEAEKIP